MTAPIPAARVPNPPVRVQYLVTWLRENREASTVAALRGLLVAAGHSVVEVDLAIARLRDLDAAGYVQAAPPDAFPPVGAPGRPYPTRGGINLDAPTADSPRTLIRLYTGNQQGDAVTAFQLESRELAKQGYYPVSQSWAQGQWGAGAWIFALLLCIVVIGLLVFVYMLIVKPAGTLTVTYTRNDAIPTPQPPSAQVAPAPDRGSVRERIAQLDELHHSGVVTDEEYAAKRAKILDEI